MHRAKSAIDLESHFTSAPARTKDRASQESVRVSACGAVQVQEVDDGIDRAPEGSAPAFRVAGIGGDR